MTKTQRDLLAACYNKHIKAEYSPVRSYAVNFRKYDILTMRDINEVVEKLKEINKKEGR